MTFGVAPLGTNPFAAPDNLEQGIASVANLAVTEDDDSFSSAGQLTLGINVLMLNVTEDNDVLSAYMLLPGRPINIGDIYPLPVGWKKAFWDRVHFKDMTWRF